MVSQHSTFHLDTHLLDVANANSYTIFVFELAFIAKVPVILIKTRQTIDDNAMAPQNILIRYPGPDWWVKIGDFGISKRAIEGLTVCRTFTGTLGFLAPEILARQGLIDAVVYSGMKEFTSAVDIWSLGEIMYRCLTGSSTFASPAKISRFTNGKLPLPLDKLRSEWEITDEGCQFLRRVLEIQPKHRMSASEALGHPWLVSLSEISPRSSEEIIGDASETEENDLMISMDNLSIASSEGSARWSTIDHGYAERKLPHKDATTITFKADTDRPGEVTVKNIQPSTKTVRLQKSTTSHRGLPIIDGQILLPTTTGANPSKSQNSRGTVVTEVPEIRVQESPGLQAGESQRSQREHRHPQPTRSLDAKCGSESGEGSLGPPPGGTSRPTRIDPSLFPLGKWASSERSESPKTRRAKARRYLYDEIRSVRSPRSEDGGVPNGHRTVSREPGHRTRSPSPIGRPPIGANAPKYYYPTPAASVRLTPEDTGVADAHRGRADMPAPTYHRVDDEDPRSRIDFRSQKARRVRAESVSSPKSLYANVGYSPLELYGEGSGPEVIKWSRRIGRRIGPEGIEWIRSSSPRRDKDGDAKPILSRHPTSVY